MRPPWRFLLGRCPWRTLVYVLSSAAIGFLLLPVTIVTLLLLPLWGIVIGALERRRTRLLGFPRQTSGHVPLSRDQRHIWLAVRVAEGATWRETAALLLDLVLGWIALAVLFVQGLCLVVFVFIGVSGSRGPAQINLFADVRIVVGPDNWWPVIPIALLAVCLFAYVNAVLAAGQASLLRVLCGPRQRELARNVERLVQSRAALVAAFEAERRRIERDLHDGVQQELVTLAARLGMVSLELVGAAIAWGGVRSGGRIAAVVVSLVLLWLVPALATAVQSAVGSRALLRDSGELLDYGGNVFQAAVTMPSLVLPRLAVAVIVAAAGIGGRMLVSRRRRAHASSG